MNFGPAFQAWITTNLQALVIAGIVCVGLYILVTRQFTKLAGLLVVAFIAVGFAFNPMGVKTLLLNLFKKIFG